VDLHRVFDLAGWGCWPDSRLRAVTTGGPAKASMMTLGKSQPPGELFSETNDNSVAILLTYGTARILLADNAEAREEEYIAGGPYTGLLTQVRVSNN
jgi:beta-lactamase superfamily II metal-dependent hydrolase